MVAGAHFGRFECHIPGSVQTPYADCHVLRLHYIAAFTYARHGFCGTNRGPAENRWRRNGVRGAKAPTGVRGYRELETVWD